MIRSNNKQESIRLKDNTEATPTNRRPLTSRSTSWAQWLANTLVRARISPNAISVVSVAFASVGAFLLLMAPSFAALIGVAVCVQLRLLCNLLDGMVAIEGKRQSATGALYNELPDRIADSLFIVALGYAIGASWIGWLGALAAAVTAYIRVLGGALGCPQDFRGPLAKPQRMAVLTAGCLIGAIELAIQPTQWALSAAAWIIAIGSVVTCITRTFAIATLLRQRAA
jgi:phosphatidylglycerophosphate synthase